MLGKGIAKAIPFLRAPRKIGFAAINGQGQRRPRHESQSALSDETGIFRDALKEVLENSSTAPVRVRRLRWSGFSGQGPSLTSEAGHPPRADQKSCGSRGSGRLSIGRPVVICAQPGRSAFFSSICGTGLTKRPVEAGDQGACPSADPSSFVPSQDGPRSSAPFAGPQLDLEAALCFGVEVGRIVAFQ